jgi:UDP:flavonoid glycosyltransferase YjiC (YdhE family)
MFTTQPILSHLLPMLPMARVLQAAGHSVAVASTSELAPWIRAFGLKPLVVGPDWCTDHDVAEVMRMRPAHLGPSDVSFVLRNLFVRVAGRKSLRGMEDIAASFEPNLVVSESTEFCGRIVGERRGIPTVVLSYGVELGTHLASQLLDNSLDDLRTMAGLPRDPEFHCITGTASLCIAPSSYTAGHARSRVHSIVPVACDRLDGQEAPAWLSALPDRPTVYVTLGNSFGRIKGLIDSLQQGLAREDINVVLTVGRGNRGCLSGTPARNCFVAEYLANSLVLPKCRAVVCHGGYGTVMGALRHGLPMVLLPIGADNFLQAARCSRLGAAVTVPWDGTGVAVSAVRDAVRHVLASHGERAAAVRIRGEIERMAPIEDVCDLLEEVR